MEDGEISVAGALHLFLCQHANGELDKEISDELDINIKDGDRICIIMERNEENIDISCALWKKRKDRVRGKGVRSALKFLKRIANESNATAKN